MRKELLVVDDFYSDPFTVKEKALNFEYKQNIGSSYFMRSKPFIQLELIKNIEFLFQKTLNLEDGNWDDKSVYNGSFYMLDPAKSPPNHIHHDQHEWVGVLSLDTTPPINRGHVDATIFWTHLRTGRSSAKDITKIDELCSEGNNFNRWMITDQVVHKFNRAIFYPGARFHSASIGTISRCNQLFAFSFK